MTYEISREFLNDIANKVPRDTQTMCLIQLRTMLDEYIAALENGYDFDPTDTNKTFTWTDDDISETTTTGGTKLSEYT